MKDYFKRRSSYSKHLASRLDPLYQTSATDDPGKRKTANQPPVHASQVVKTGLILHQEHVVLEVLLRGGDGQPDRLDVDRTHGLFEWVGYRAGR